jgi:hypothetical protein
MNPRVLADVERVQMEAEGAHLQNERIDERARDAHPRLAASEARSTSPGRRGNPSTEQ